MFLLTKWKILVIIHRAKWEIVFSFGSLLTNIMWANSPKGGAK